MYVFLKSPQKEVVHSKNYKAEFYQSILDHQTTLLKIRTYLYKTGLNYWGWGKAWSKFLAY